jgi:uncharacterized glyoxalase superfamily protein PhnB
MKSLTPLVTVDRIEPCLGFWTERLGFTLTISVPGEDGLGFAAVELDGIEVMYQTYASVAEDIPALAEETRAGTSIFFTEVENLDGVMSKMDGVEVVVPRRKTFYGMEEVFVRAPCGTVVGLAQPVED